MKFLQAPWRWSFISELIRKEKGCVFCNAKQAEGLESLICFRGEHFFVILNKFPYNTGHLMIVPYEHLDSPDKVPAEQSVEMMTLLNYSLEVLKSAFNPNGFNVGMNIGNAAGAGVKSHFHLHVVPRWSGDANFMATVGQTKVMSYDLETVYKKLTASFKKYQS